MTHATKEKPEQRGERSVLDSVPSLVSVKELASQLSGTKEQKDASLEKLRVLASKGADITPALPALLPFYEDEEAREKAHAVVSEALKNPACCKKTAHTLGELLTDDDGDIRWWACGSLDACSKDGGDVSGAMGDMFALLKGEEYEYRGAIKITVANAIANPKGKAAMDATIAALGSGETELVDAAASIIGLAASQNADVSAAVPAMMKAAELRMAGGENGDFVEILNEVLKSKGAAQKEVMDTLLRWLNSDDGELARGAVVVLSIAAGRSIDISKAVPGIMDIVMDSRDSEARMYAANALRQVLGKAGEKQGAEIAAALAVALARTKVPARASEDEEESRSALAKEKKISELRAYVMAALAEAAQRFDISGCAGTLSKLLGDENEEVAEGSELCLRAAIANPSSRERTLHELKAEMGRAEEPAKARLVKILGSGTLSTSELLQIMEHDAEGAAKTAADGLFNSDIRPEKEQKAVLNRLVGMFSHTNPVVRARAARAVPQYENRGGPEFLSAVGALVELCGDEELQVNEAAKNALKKIIGQAYEHDGPERASALLNEVLNGLKDENPSIRACALSVIRYATHEMSPSDVAAALPLVLGTLGDKDDFVWMAAMDFFYDQDFIQKSGYSMVSGLQALVGGMDPLARRNAVTALGYAASHGGDVSAAVGDLAWALGDENVEVRMEALMALDQAVANGTDISRAEGALSRISTDTLDALAANAAAVLARIGKPKEEPAETE